MNLSIIYIMDYYSRIRAHLGNSKCELPDTPSLKVNYMEEYLKVPLAKYLGFIQTENVVWEIHEENCGNYSRDGALFRKLIIAE